MYPTAIGSEPDHPNFDTQPLWQQVIVGNGVANGTFMVVPNRHGSEGLITFYGSSFISTRTDASSFRLRATNQPSWSQISTCSTVKTGLRCSRSWPLADPTPTRP